MPQITPTTALLYDLINGLAAIERLVILGYD